MYTQGKRKALGQHFLKDESIALKIATQAIDEAERHGCPALLEIGPGKGALTRPLLQMLKTRGKPIDFLLVERDTELAATWKVESLLSSQSASTTFPFQIEAGDFLQVPAQRWLAKGPLAVVSNLPYSTGTAILNQLSEHYEKIPVMVLMFQAEVAKRLRAEPSSSGRGSLSVWMQNIWDIEKLVSVPPKAFAPPPLVDSETVVLTRRKEPQVPGTWEPEGAVLWEKLLKTCFSQRRKMLRSLPQFRTSWQNALEQSGVDVTKRAEALGWDEWNNLFQALRKA